jgi:hypothetical protein
MLTVFIPLRSALEKNGCPRANIRLGAHCTERPEVNQDKPNPKAFRLRGNLPGPSTSAICTANALGTRRRLRRRSGISPLYDVKKTAGEIFASGNVAL